MARETMDDVRTQLATARTSLDQARAVNHRLYAVLAVIQAALVEALKEPDDGRA